MREIFEFRVPEKYASRLFHSDEGVRLGETIRKIMVSGDDSRLQQVGELDKAINAQATEPPRYFFSGWDIRRRYTKAELSAAKAFKLGIKNVFEPAGEECGTVYDESTACPTCGAGATQSSDLRLDLRRVPKNKDIARTIADEIIVSQRMVELMIDARLTGFDLRRVRHKARYEEDPLDFHQVPIGREILQRAEAAGFPHPTGRFWVWLNRRENSRLADKAHEQYAAIRRESSRRRGKPAPIWYQLLVASTPVDITPPTRAGINPFDDDATGECRCSRGDTIGLNLLSELSISQQQFETCNCDIVETRQYVGVRRGLLRPTRLLIISPRVRTLLLDAGVKGIELEVVYPR